MRKTAAIILLIISTGILFNPAWAWHIERPRRASGDKYCLPSRTENSTTDSIASVGLGVNPSSYIEKAGGIYGDSDVVFMNVTMTANSRKHIAYTYSTEQGTYWVDPDPRWHTVIFGEYDDYGFRVNLTPPSDPYNYAFRFWGGAGDPYSGTNSSADYTSIWISTNGFIAFDESNSNISTPTSIPSPQAPNAIIAAVWSDLRLDYLSSIIYGWRWYAYYSGWSFFVTWDYVEHKASGERLTFQIQLGNAPGYAPGSSYIVWGQSQFKISYQEVYSINTDFAFGIEDQEGYKGFGGLFLGSNLSSFNGKSYWFQQAPESSNYFLSKLTLTLNDTCTQTRFHIWRESTCLRGYNVALKAPKYPDVDERYKVVLGGEKTLLSKIGGIIVEATFIGLELVGFLARSMYSTVEYLKLSDQFEDTIPYGAYAIASVPPGYQRPYGSAVDALIGIYVDWILDDANNMKHSLTITAKLEYYEITWDGNVVETPYTLTTSVNLEILLDSPDKVNNNSFENATQIQKGTYSWLYADQTDDVFDFYKVYVESQKSLQVTVEVDSDDNLDLYLYNGPSREYLIAKSENGIGQDEYAHGEQLADPGAWWYIEVNATWEYGFYNMTISFEGVPSTPSTPSGPTYGYTSSSYAYSTSTIDPEGDSVRYEFNWGDGTPNTITGWYAPGVNATASHSWASSGTYQVHARAQDIREAWSGWSSPLNVTIVNRYYLTVKTYIGTIERNLKVWIDSVQYYSPVTVLVAQGTHTVEVQSSFWSGSYEYVFYQWEDSTMNNPRSVTLTSDRILKAYYHRVDNCPTLFVWNGSQYIYETLLDIHAESDITVQHQIQQTLVLDGWHYKLQLWELDNFTSHIDQVKLYAVDHNGEWHTCPLINAEHSEIGYVTLKLLFNDEKRIDLAPTETVNLKFLPSIPSNETVHFIFEINGHNKKIE